MALDQVIHPAAAQVVNPVVVILDASETMAGQVSSMYRHVEQGFASAAASGEVFERVVVAVVVISRDRAEALPLGPRGEHFVPIGDLSLPNAPAGEGVTPLHDAVDVALGLIAAEHGRIRQAGSLRGTATLILAGDGRPTDYSGRPTDAWRAAAARLRAAREEQLVVPAALAFGGADHETLRAFAPRIVVDGGLDALARLISIATLSVDRGRADGALDEPVTAAEDQILNDLNSMFGRA